MEKDNHKTFVRFVIFKGEVLAVFMRHSAESRYIPARPATNAGTGESCTIPGQWVRGCYARVGQHSECYDGMEKRKQATPEQYESLAKEMTGLGYNLVIMNKE